MVSSTNKKVFLNILYILPFLYFIFAKYKENDPKKNSISISFICRTISSGMRFIDSTHTFYYTLYSAIYSNNSSL